MGVLEPLCKWRYEIKMKKKYIKSAESKPNCQPFIFIFTANRLWPISSHGENACPNMLTTKMSTRKMIWGGKVLFLHLVVVARMFTLY